MLGVADRAGRLKHRYFRPEISWMSFASQHAQLRAYRKNSSLHCFCAPVSYCRERGELTYGAEIELAMESLESNLSNGVGILIPKNLSSTRYAVHNSANLLPLSNCNPI